MPALSYGQVMYLAVWGAACSVALILVLTDPCGFGFLQVAYRRFLIRPWRLIVFGVVLTGMVALAPYSGTRPGITQTQPSCAF